MLISRRHWNSCSLALLCAGLSACKQVKNFGGAFADLMQLQVQLAQKLGHTQLDLQIINGSLLRIEVVNSALSKLPARERQAKSLEIAQFAYNSMASRSLLSNILVVFSTKRSYLLLIHTQVVDSHVLYPVKVLSQNSNG